MAGLRGKAHGAVETLGGWNKDKELLQSCPPSMGFWEEAAPRPGQLLSWQNSIQPEVLGISSEVGLTCCGHPEEEGPKWAISASRCLSLFPVKLKRVESHLPGHTGPLLTQLPQHRLRPSLHLFFLLRAAALGTLSAFPF